MVSVFAPPMDTLFGVFNVSVWMLKSAPSVVLKLFAAAAANVTSVGMLGGETSAVLPVAVMSQLFAVIQLVPERLCQNAAAGAATLTTNASVEASGFVSIRL